jgi:hypothetical protein
MHLKAYVHLGEYLASFNCKPSYLVKSTGKPSNLELESSI